MPKQPAFPGFRQLMKKQTRREKHQLTEVLFVEVNTHLPDTVSHPRGIHASFDAAS